MNHDWWLMIDNDGGDSQNDGNINDDNNNAAGSTIKIRMIMKGHLRYNFMR